jgi:hypothetical protein
MMALDLDFALGSGACAHGTGTGMLAMHYWAATVFFFFLFRGRFLLVFGLGRRASGRCGWLAIPNSEGK